jgi:hypothetical protein
MCIFSNTALVRIFLHLQLLASVFFSLLELMQGYNSLNFPIGNKLIKLNDISVITADNGSSQDTEYE